MADTPESLVRDALMVSTPPREHGQLCPVWTRSLESDSTAPHSKSSRGGPVVCDCFVTSGASARAERMLAHAPLAETLARGLAAEALVEALDELLDYPYIMDGHGCRGCNRGPVHDDGCPVGKALAVWSAATIGSEQRIRDVAALAEAPPATPSASPGGEFRALVDEARANHVRWEHDAELLEECLRPSCIGAKVLLWPDIENPRSSVGPAPEPHHPDCLHCVWDDVVAALPDETWWLHLVAWSFDDKAYRVEAATAGKAIHAFGPTPAASLTALRAALIGERG